MKKRILLLCIGTAVSMIACADMPVLELGVGMHRIRAEVAHTNANRMKGLMHRTELADDAGMLFVFANTGKPCMWMRNTLVPLSVAFIDEQGRIVNIEDMEPLTETTHCAAKPVRYALETNKGWFARYKIAAGARVAGIERAPAPE